MSDLEIGRLGLTLDDDPAASTREHEVTPLPMALYIHVPFCLSKCAYCDFTSSVSDPRWHAPYVDAVLFAAAHLASYDLLDDVVTIYFGGGTPTVLGDELVRLVEGLLDIATVRADAEVTVETNPDTTEVSLIAALVQAGVNRFSLGVQSLDDAVLATLGRRHTAAGALSAASVLADSGQAYSVDLICGVPGQSAQSWHQTLALAIETGAGHMSVYPLSVEEGTPLSRRVDSGLTPEPDSDEAAEMMLAAERTLSEAGFERYEVANYARPGQQSRHNSSYWTGGAYLGLGPSAASMLPHDAFAHVADAEGWTFAASEAAADLSGRVRFTTTDDTASFMRRPLAAPADIELLSAEETLREDVMLGMRLSSGVTARAVADAGLTDVLASLAADGLVALSADESWRVTERGWLLGNEVFGRIWQGSE